MELVESACVAALIVRRRKTEPNRQYWVHPIISQRLLKGQFHKLYEDLREYPRKFFAFHRMSIGSFDELLATIGPSISYQDTKFRNSIPCAERLSVTLRYLATGNSFQSLHFEFLLGATTIREIVRDTCDKLWIYLQPVYLARKSQSDWISIADEFYERTQFPNCIGAIDGKHIRLKQPSNTGSLYYNYKQYFSIVLLALVDADYCFSAVDIGAYGGSSDSHVFQRSPLGKRLERNQLNIPSGRLLPNDEDRPMPFVIVGDEAFSLSEHVLRPYAKRNLTITKRIFNYRLTRARRMVECAFGILANKWRIFHRPLDVAPDFCDAIVKACCVLHNYVRKHDGIQFEDTLYTCPLEDIANCNIRGTGTGLQIRDYFANYFTSPSGSIPWQYDKI